MYVTLTINCDKFLARHCEFNNSCVSSRASAVGRLLFFLFLIFVSHYDCKMDEVLIEKVKSNEIIYNQKLPTFRDKTLKRAVWDQIGKELEITGSQAKLRWDTLRRCYSNARNRRRDGGCKQAWKYAKQMSFILPFTQDRSSKYGKGSSFVDVSYKHDNFTVEGYSEDNTADEMATQFKIETDECNFDDEPEDAFQEGNEPIAVPETVEFHCSDSDDQNKDDVALEEEQHYTRQKAQKERSKLPRSKQKQHSAKNRKHNESNSSSNISSNDNNILGSFDHMDLFFLSMSKMTKQLPNADQSKIKFELSNLVLSCEMKHNETQS